MQRQAARGQDLVFEGGGEPVVEHLLMENRGDAARHGGHNPHPVGRAAPPAAVLILHVLNERLGGRVVVNNGHFVTLWVERGQGVRREETLGYFRTPSPTEQRFPKGGPGDDFSQCQRLLCSSLSILVSISRRKSPFGANVSLTLLLPMSLSPSPLFSLTRKRNLSLI